MGDPQFLLAILTSVLITATPLLMAATGELVAERAGVLNLGVEGMMIIGAVAGFMVGWTLGPGGHPLQWGLPGWAAGLIGMVAAALAGAAFSLIHAGLTIGLGTNQVASGLALVLFGQGLAKVLGTPFVGDSLVSLEKLSPWPGVLLAFLMAFVVYRLLGRTQGGLILRAVGDDHDSAHALGHPVRLTRTVAVMVGGAMAGLGGGFLSLVHVPSWSEEIIAGKGWIALALVVFSGWRPLLVIAGAMLFGGFAILELHVQATGGARLPFWPVAATALAIALALWRREQRGPVSPPALGLVVALVAALLIAAFALAITGPMILPSQVLTTLPYLATLVVLTLISAFSGQSKGGVGPSMLGRPFHATG